MQNEPMTAREVLIAAFAHGQHGAGVEAPIFVAKTYKQGNGVRKRSKASMEKLKEQKQSKAPKVANVEGKQSFVKKTNGDKVAQALEAGKVLKAVEKQAGVAANAFANWAYAPNPASKHYFNCLLLVESKYCEKYGGKWQTSGKAEQRRIHNLMICALQDAKCIANHGKPHHSITTIAEFTQGVEAYEFAGSERSVKHTGINRREWAEQWQAKYQFMLDYFDGLDRKAIAAVDDVLSGLLKLGDS